MNPIVGWGLAFVALVAGWYSYGWQGVVLVVTAIVFWLLIQFSRALRVMKNAATSPKGEVGSAVMLNAKLKAGMTLMQVIGITRSLGEQVSQSPETWAWHDAGHSRVTLVFQGGRLQQWQLIRPEAAPE
jgi:phosphatidylglycerophosphate synthase